MPEPVPGNMQEERVEARRPTLKELHPKENLALAIGLAVLAACQPAIEATPTPTPTLEPTAVPTEVVPTPAPEVEQEPTPTVVSRDISLLERQFGGEAQEGRTSELFVASYREEEQRGFKSTLENGQVWFVLGIYPELPEFDLEADLDPATGNEVVYYTNQETGERMVFLTARGQSEEAREGLPFFDPTVRATKPYGSFYFVKEGRIAGTEEPFVALQENEVSVVFNREAGRYEFKDEAGEVTRTIEVFKIPLPAPELAGLRIENNAYYAQEGNPYGLEVGAYVGERIVFNEGRESGIVLIPSVVRVLMEQTNTPEARERNEWKIPVSLDPRGESSLLIEEWFTQLFGHRWGFLKISGISTQAVFVSPFDQAKGVNRGYSPLFSGPGKPGIFLELPREWDVEAFAFVIHYLSGSVLTNEGAPVRLGEPILTKVEGELAGPQAPSGVQVLIGITPSLEATGPDLDFGITDNILEIDGNRVFLAQST